MKKNYLILLGWWLSTVSICAQPFWSEDFSDGSFPTDWTTDDPTMVGVLWEHCANFYQCEPFAQTNLLAAADIDLPRFAARTADNGYVFAHSDSPNSSAYESLLTTPSIDCSDKNQVVLAFSSNLIYILRRPSESAFIRVRNENNDFVSYPIFPTWDEGVPALPITSTWNGQTLYVDITAAAAGFSEVEVQWQWKGFNDLSWSIDDVELFDYHPLYENSVWGMATGEGDFAGGLNDWEVITNSECGWEWQEKGWIDNQSATQNDYLSICSHTPSNGAAILNATLCASMQGAPETFSHLISPPIDLSNVPADCQISLRFFQQVEIGNRQNNDLPITGLSWSVDGGTAWSELIDVNPLAEFLAITCDEKNILLPDELIGEPDVRFRFTFKGFSFYWAIDDVRVMQNAAYDLLLKNNFFAIAPNFQTPKSQVDSFGLLVDFQNIGKEMQENVQLTARIYEGNNQVLLWADSLYFDQIESLQLIENQLFNQQFTLPNEPGRYYGKYDISADQPDARPTNNSLLWEFEITDSIFAKERGFRSAFAPDGAATYEMGNCFYLPHGEGFIADKVTFGIATYPSFQGANLLIQFYKWNISSPTDSIAENSELELLGIQGYVNTALSSGLQLITVPLDPFAGDQILLEDDSYYLLTIAYISPLNCNGGPCPFFIGASDEFNYNANYFLSRNLTASPRYASVYRQNNNQPFNTIGFNLKRTPVVRLHIKSTTVDTKLQSVAADWAIFPNPASSAIFIETDENFPSIKSMTVIDMTGRIILEKPFSSNLSNPYAIDVRPLEKGTYVLQLFLKNGSMTERTFVKMD